MRFYILLLLQLPVKVFHIYTIQECTYLFWKNFSREEFQNPKCQIFLKFQIFSLFYNHIDWLDREPMSILFSQFFCLSHLMKNLTAMTRILLLTLFYTTLQSYLTVCLWNFTLMVRKAIFSFYWHIFHVLYRELKFGNILHRFLLPLDFQMVVKHLANTSRRVLQPFIQ